MLNTSHKNWCTHWADLCKKASNWELVFTIYQVFCCLAQHDLFSIISNNWSNWLMWVTWEGFLLYKSVSNSTQSNLSVAGYWIFNNSSPIHKIVDRYVKKILKFQGKKYNSFLVCGIQNPYANITDYRNLPFFKFLI